MTGVPFGNIFRARINLLSAPGVALAPLDSPLAIICRAFSALGKAPQNPKQLGNLRFFNFKSQISNLKSQISNPQAFHCFS
jgi:hypothetical protein